MRIGLFFGSFSPIHQGHLIIGQFILNQTELDEIWYVVSPQNPLKSAKDIYDEKDRLKMVELAVADNPNFKACDIEFSMTKPSYTAYTMRELGNKYPEHEFTIIMGSDNLQHFDKWKDHEEILLKYDMIAYFRDGFPGGDFAKNQKVRLMKGPLLNINSTFIRGILRMGKSVKYMVPDSILSHLGKMHDS
jgi:nicotinate-nucleotide adenylyltransferase